MKYIVMVSVCPHRTYDFFTAEYSGVEHDDLADAIKERDEAKNDIDVSQAWIICKGV